MKISIERVELGKADWEGKHILTVAEAGFSMLSIYGEQRLGIPLENINRFSETVNVSGFDTLHPAAPLSAISKRYFREHDRYQSDQVLDDFRTDLQRFFTLNEQEIKASSILVDFHVCSLPVPWPYLQITEEALRLLPDSSIIQDAVLLK